MDKFAVRCKKCWSIKQERKICETCNRRASAQTPLTLHVHACESCTRPGFPMNIVLRSEGREVRFPNGVVLFSLPFDIERVVLERAPVEPYPGQEVWDRFYGTPTPARCTYESTVLLRHGGREYAAVTHAIATKISLRRHVPLAEAWFVRELVQVPIAQQEEARLTRMKHEAQVRAGVPVLVDADGSVPAWSARSKHF